MTSTTMKFVYFPPSPWSEKARWALEKSGIQHKTIVYTPLLTTFSARLLSQNYLSKVSVPLARHGRHIMSDSLDIARYSNQHRANESVDLLPSELEEKIVEWNELSESLLNILRSKAVERMKKDRNFLIANLPPFIPKSLRPYMTSVSKLGLYYLTNKYSDQPSNADQVLHDGLVHIRNALNASGGEYLLSHFSYADIVIAATLQAIKPVEHTNVYLDPTTRRCWTDEALSEEFQDLLQWRDQIYNKHR